MNLRFVCICPFPRNGNMTASHRFPCGGQARSPYQHHQTYSLGKFRLFVCGFRLLDWLALQAVAFVDSSRWETAACRFSRLEARKGFLRESTMLQKSEMLRTLDFLQKKQFTNIENFTKLWNCTKPDILRNSVNLRKSDSTRKSDILRKSENLRKSDMFGEIYKVYQAI